MNHCRKAEWLEFVSKSFEELAHELHPIDKKNSFLVEKFEIKLPTTYQCNRRVCKKAESPSIITKMAKVKNAQMPNTT